MRQHSIVIALDGYSSCGKSTLARDLAKALSYTYVDTGAMYRAVTLHLTNNEIDHSDEEKLKAALESINIHFEYDENGRQQTFLNKQNVEKEIREKAISNKVSEISAIPAIREKLVAEQKMLGSKKRLVMDGRDIGTKVFPNAELKLFMTADEEIRVERRFTELKEKGVSISKDEVRENLKSRDYQDTHREHSPLTRAKDAIVFDNTKLNREEQLQKALNLAKSKMAEAITNA